MNWIDAMLDAESRYLTAINDYKWKPEQARSVLPNSLKTEIVVTANLRQWRTIFKQRTANVAQPQMREVMVPLLRNLNQIPIVFDDINI